jgi:mRNA-degrading endonuclease RelE of RelBE toxin-antitoxin system
LSAIEPNLARKLNKLSRRDKKTYETVTKKMNEILLCPDLDSYYKSLKYDLNDRKRVHVGHFVLTFKYILSENKVVFLDFDHHDKIYEN